MRSASVAVILGCLFLGGCACSRPCPEPLAVWLSPPLSPLSYDIDCEGEHCTAFGFENGRSVPMWESSDGGDSWRPIPGR